MPNNLGKSITITETNAIERIQFYCNYQIYDVFHWRHVQMVLMSILILIATILNINSLQNSKTCVILSTKKRNNYMYINNINTVKLACLEKRLCNFALYTDLLLNTTSTKYYFIKRATEMFLKTKIILRRTLQQKLQIFNI